jgi:hypothetical protein
LNTVKPYPPETIGKYAETVRAYAENIVLRT